MFNKLLSKFKKSEVIVNRLIIDSNADIENNGKLTESFGIRIFDGTIAPFSKEGDDYPASGSYSFSTDEDEQDQITLEFHRSATVLASEESFIAKVRIRGYELEAAREPVIRIHYEISNGEISIWAFDEKNSQNILLSVVKNTEGESVH